MEKILMLRRIKGKRSVLQKIRWVDSITDSVDMDLSKVQETVEDGGSLACCSPWGRKEWDRS